MILHSPTHSRRRAAAAAFSLVELLVVLGIVAVLLALAFPLFKSIHESSNLRRTAQSIVDELNLARQTALTKNCQVEVRFYQSEGDSGIEDQYRAMALVEMDGSNPPQLGRPIFFSGAVIASQDQAYRYSPLIGNNIQALATEGDDLAEAGKYAAFRFRPSGETNLRPLTGPTGDGWYLTVHTLPGSKPGSLPANYATISINALTGRAQVFQP